MILGSAYYIELDKLASNFAVFFHLLLTMPLYLSGVLFESTR